MDQNQNLKHYYMGIDAGLKARMNLVRRLIGDAHWLSDGYHKEELIKEAVRPLISAHIEIQRGFVVDIEMVCSTELDIIFVDPNKGPLWYKSPGLIISQPKAVVAVMHIKTEAGTKEIISAIDSANRLRNMYPPKQQPIQILYCFGNGSKAVLENGKHNIEALDLIITTGYLAVRKGKKRAVLEDKENLGIAVLLHYVMGACHGEQNGLETILKQGWYTSK